MRNEFDYDVVVIGSGFGGSVTALRLTEKGYRVGVLEAGRRFADEQFAKTSWDVRKFLWAPRLGCFGIQVIGTIPRTASSTRTTAYTVIRRSVSSTVRRYRPTSASTRR
jgi:choline dehydrogenase-like flavoprotein